MLIVLSSCWYGPLGLPVFGVDGRQRTPTEEKVEPTGEESRNISHYGGYHVQGHPLLSLLVRRIGKGQGEEVRYEKCLRNVSLILVRPFIATYIGKNGYHHVVYHPRRANPFNVLNQGVFG